MFYHMFSIIRRPPNRLSIRKSLGERVSNRPIREFQQLEKTANIVHKVCVAQTLTLVLTFLIYLRQKFDTFNDFVLFIGYFVSDTLH